MTLLRHLDRRVTDITWDVGFTSPGTFSRTFADVVGCSPTDFRKQHTPIAVPSCFIAAWTRPRVGSRKSVVSEKSVEVCPL